eukprot:2537927-Prymnesium_polylepis.1
MKPRDNPLGYTGHGLALYWNGTLRRVSTARKMQTAVLQCTKAVRASLNPARDCGVAPLELILSTAPC